MISHSSVCAAVLVVSVAACSFDPASLFVPAASLEDGERAGGDGQGDVQSTGDAVATTGDDRRADADSGGDGGLPDPCPPFVDGTPNGTAIDDTGLHCTAQGGALDPDTVGSDVIALFPFDGGGTVADGTVIRGSGPRAFAAMVVDPDGIGIVHVAGKLSNGIGFDGANDGIELLDALPNDGPFTMAVWVNADNNASRTILELRRSTGELSWHLGLYGVTAGTKLQTLVANEACTIDGFVSIPTLSPGGWYHVAATFQIGQPMRLFVNGEPAGTSDFPTTWTSVCMATATWRLGTGTFGTWLGGMDELVIYDRILSDGELRNLYRRQGPALNCTFTSGLCDAEADASWSTFVPVPYQPYFKSLPEGIESFYAAGVVDTTALVASWPFTHIGSVVVDSPIFDEIGSRIALTQDQVTYGEPGRVQTAWRTARFADPPGWLLLDTDSDLLRGASAFTVAFWYRQYARPAVEGTLIAFSKADPAAERLSLGVTGSGLMTMKWSFGAEPLWTSTTVQAPIRDMEWVHIAAIGDHATQELKLHINGSPDGIVTQALYGTGYEDVASSVVTLGKNLDQSSGDVRGWFDELSVWHRALTDDELAALYRRSASRLRYQVRSCSRTDCADSVFSGPNGNAAVFFSEEANRSSAPPFYIPAVSPARYFQYQILFDSLDSVSPYVTDVNVLPTLP